MKNIQKLEEKQRRKINHDLEKIVIAVSGPLEIPKSFKDLSTGSTYSDSESVTGKMTFIANKDTFTRWETWMKENDQWDEIDEIYVFDRFHKSGDDMIKRCSMHLHEFSWSITLKDEFKECWFGGEVSGCKLWNEHALDPENKAWN
tara:strand:+ start:437 stop:874 length:438 start_codon:yes stop_codon:yes gene_type:complete